MEHHHHHHSHEGAASLRTAFFLNLAFTLLEIVGGFWTNSLAILSDAIHDLGDSLSLGLAWYMERYSQRGRDRRFSYGYRRFSLLGAVISTIVLIVGSLFILSEAIPRLMNPEPAYAPGMALFALVGILVNGLAVLRLRGNRSLNARVVAWHLLEDVLGWAAVLVVSLILLFWNAYILDAILSILITLYVLYNVAGNLRQTLALFLQAVPENVDVEEIERQLLAIDRVRSVHHTHVWSLDGEHHVLTTHVVVDEEASKDDVLRVKGAIKTLTDALDVSHTTAEIEYQDEDCRMAELM
ncbi:MAG: cation diffusion facilitator family transporter [Chloroflexi bacterium]|nr:cation diffusion facilitator family transporter [Chloroflexota bacterium]MCI0646367.1 cation diffusion facilitator family transporter [Chloroflexota bacterium]MCI0728375.1 cation diffusion facilitator family transporter [Chloroflexota bacterium]